MRTLNLGILAHVDAGKTTLTERLLFTAGAIDHVGSVDAGTTQTDSLELERERGITIRSAVASFLVGDLAVNLVDTPGHPDFIAEVERVLGVLDGAVLVVSAVEGVQPQTPLLFRALQRLRVPTLIFVNKIDRAGADDRRVVEAMARRLSPAVVPMETVRDAGRRRRPSGRSRRRRSPSDGARRGRSPSTTRRSSGPTSATSASLSDHDCASSSPRRPGAALVHPVFFGSAAHGHRRRRAARRRRRAPAAARRRSGCARLRPRLQDRAHGLGRARRLRPPVRRHAPRRASAWRSAGEGTRRRPRSASSPRPARRVATSSRPGRWQRSGGSARSGSATRSASRRPARSATARFPRPALEAVVVRPEPEQQGSLRAALSQLAEQDPLIDVRQDDARHEISVSLYGEVQKEVIQATLERDYGIGADFRETTIVCIERPARRRRGRRGHPGQDPHEHHRPQLAAQHEPVPGDAGPPDRAGGRSARASSSAPTSSRAHPALPVQDGRHDGRPDGGVRPRGAGRGPRRLAGDRLPGHDDRLRLRLTGHVARPTTGGSPSSS